MSFAGYSGLWKEYINELARLLAKADGDTASPLIPRITHAVRRAATSSVWPSPSATPCTTVPPICFIHVPLQLFVAG